MHNSILSCLFLYLTSSGKHFCYVLHNIKLEKNIRQAETVEVAISPYAYNRAKDKYNPVPGTKVKKFNIKATALFLLLIADTHKFFSC